MEESYPSFSDIKNVPWARGDLHKGDLRAALNGFAVRHVLFDYKGGRKNSDADLCGFGTVLWLMGDREGAAWVWANVSEEAYRGRISYSSSGCYQGPLLLWFASVWLKSEDWHTDAEQTVDKLLRRRRLVMGARFPSKLARVLHKEMTIAELKETELRKKAETFPGSEPTIDPFEEIEIAFYNGVRAYEEAGPNAALEAWRDVPTVKDGPLEYYLLLHEREKLAKL